VSSLDLWPIGNCQVSALIDRAGDFIWACVPRVDGDPYSDALVSVSGRTTSARLVRGPVFGDRDAEDVETALPLKSQLQKLQCPLRLRRPQRPRRKRLPRPRPGQRLIAT
jgi:hypothetical protein